MKEKEENGEKICEEIKREREKWEKEKLEEKTRKEEEGKKRREKEQRNCDEFIHRLKEEREDLQSKHEKEINKMKIVMEEMNREREKLMKKEKERMKMMMEEQQNQEKQRREEEFREREKYKREMKEQEEQMRDKMKRIKEMSKELETVKKENYIEIDRLMNRIENERRHHDERKRREEEFNEREERYKREMKEKEREIHELKTVMEKGQKNIIILLSADNNDQKTSNENTSSETIRKHHSNGKSLNVAHNIKNNWSKKIEGGDNEHLPMFKVNLNETWQSRDGFCRRRLFGKNNTKENKTIMMIGATGAGKTTLINSMINYILGVQWEDDFRFVLIDEGKQKSQAESQTSEITAYQINHMNGFRIPYSLTIVDTPGFGDTRGISQDQKITKQIQELFSAPGGIDCINAVCFVVQASLARLTHTQRYIFDSILSIFGKDIAQNIIVLVTFADGKTPPVLEAIKVSEVPCSTDESGEPLHFKFNNSAVFATNNKSADDEESDCENFDQMFWKLGFSSMKKFFTSLNTMKTQSLCLTQEVLKERQQLEVFLEGLQPQISAGLTKLGEIKKTRAALEQHKAEMDANKDFEYELEVTVPKQIENTTGNYLTNCQTCHFTCHDKCIYANDSDKYKCSAMKDGKCRVCPGKCVWNVHFNQKYKWDYVKEKRKETYQELKKRYEDAHGQVMSKEKIFEELEKEFHVVQGIVAKLIKGSQMSLERLQDIALKPNPLSTPDYIDLMIESEKQEAKPGFHDRIQSLMEVRKKAEIISKVSTGEVLSDDWKAYKTLLFPFLSSPVTPHHHLTDHQLQK
ncbi:hypothetical protein Q8A67_001520 [Cirrhinus molitorella]|uniref:AIG1-type G domain-containing protein n=1 Tax=Cirrhinus molitorella TaxID=172907 RepID=A0AA88Q9Z1_9TELE|nr:hypothetical protein Q8A67_001520 [Cirrhinus molitorella]